VARAAVLGKTRFDRVALAMLSRANWDPAKRLDLMAELDAAFFLLFGIKRPDVEYIFSTFSGVRKESKTMLADSSVFDRILTHHDVLSRSRI
jgi:hypothetical protein